MSSSTPSLEDEPSRKRIRKGTKSCWECKRRKIRCQLSSEDVPVCSGCLARGTTCLSQEYPEERDASSGGQIGERLGRVERLLEKLVSKIESYEEEENVHQIMTPESVANDVLTPYAKAASANSNVSDNAPFLTVFDNSAFGRRDIAKSQATSPSVQTTGPRTPSCRTSKPERVRQALIDLLPSQQDADLIRSASKTFLLLQAVRKGQEEVPPNMFNMAEVAKLQPTAIARSILYLAVCVQQLDHNFDVSRLHLLPSVDARIDKYMTTVQALITSDDEMVSTMEGLECLTLQGMYHVNAGNPRRAWLTFRRALNLGQLMGLQRNNGSSPLGRRLWCNSTEADRYLGLLLGLPPGAGDIEFGPEDTFQNPKIDSDNLFTKKLSNIVGRILERNQSELSHVYATTQTVDEMLEQLYNDMPDGWWNIPTVVVNDNSMAAMQIFNRIMAQMWYFQVVECLHLPFMLRARKERRYEYSKFSCLKASRETIDRYLALRKAAGILSFCCNIVDFGALTSAVTLYLVISVEDSSMSENPAQKQQQESDRALVQTVLNSMEGLAQGGKDPVATQSVSVLKSLLAIDSPSGSQISNLKLTIPYFGTISIVRSPPPRAQTQASNDSYLEQNLQQQQSLRMETGLMTQEPYTPQTPNLNGKTPMISFMSSQFPEYSCQAPVLQQPEQHQQIQDWTLPEDNLFFDSLLQTDLEGNWIF